MSSSVENNSQFDYIIVGAGSSGGVIANRLSEDPNIRVCLLEAGKPANSFAINMPGALLLHMHWFKYNWAYTTNPDPSSNNRSHFNPRGKVIGGSSSINGMCYIRGNDEDYNHWESLGNKGWGYNDVLPYFKKSENQQHGESKFHGSGGPLHVTDAEPLFPLSKCFYQAALEYGLPENSDFNGETQEGVGSYQFTIKDGVRAGVGKSFVAPLQRRPNVTIITAAHASKIIIGDNTAKGINYTKDGKDFSLFANKEVILSCGTFNSPQLLMLSGIGPKEELEKHQIPVALELPGVGQNLQEHADILIKQESTKKDGFSLTFSGILKSLVYLFQYILSRKGPLANSVAEVGAFVKKDANSSRCDGQIIFMPFMWGDHGRDLTVLMQHGYSCHLALLRPKSRGQVTLKGNDPFTAPSIDYRLLDHPDDIKDLLKLTRILRNIFSGKAFDSYRGEEVFPGSGVESDEELTDALRKNIDHGYHPVGTCKMGNDEMAVVDDQLRVRGIKGLRVADASIMPTIPSGNTNAPCIMIGEKAADMILNG